MPKIILLTLLYNLFIQPALGQIPLQEARSELSLISRLPSLDSLIQIAVEISLSLKSQRYAMESQKDLMKLERKRFWSRIALDAGYGLSNSFSNVTVDNAEGDVGQNVVLQVGDSYRIGVTLRLSPYDILSRSNSVGAIKNKYRAAQTEWEILKREIALEVRVLYQELLTAEKLLLISSQKKNALMLQYQTAEKSFNQGEIQIPELARVTEMASNAEANFIRARQEVEIAYHRLRSHVGL